MITICNEDIFVAIAAYREPELRRTIESCIDNATSPDRLRFGVCIQYDPDGPADTQPGYLDGVAADIRTRTCHYTESKGGCWARNIVQGLYADEGYTMQIDSHMRMVSGWDDLLVAMMHEVASEKPLITGQCPLYRLVDDVDVFPDDATVPVTVANDYTDGGWLHHPAIMTYDAATSLRPTRILSGMFVFTLGCWNHEVRQDPAQLYTGEELALTIRSFTWGYDLFNPGAVVAYHRMHPEPNHKYIYDGDRDEIRWRDRRAYQRLRVLHAGDPDRILLPYSVGSARSLDEFCRWSGLDYGSRTVSDDARNGVTPRVFEASW